MFWKKKARQQIKFHNFWEIDNKQVSMSYHKLQERIGQLTPLMLPKPTINWWKMAAMAASMALLVVCGLYWFEQTHPVEQPVVITYVTDRASQITLSDGTKVWLSAH